MPGELIPTNKRYPSEVLRDGKLHTLTVFLDNPALQGVFTPQVLALYPHALYDENQREAIDTNAWFTPDAVELHCPGHSEGNLYVYAAVPYEAIQQDGLEVVVQRRIKRTGKDVEIPARLYPPRRGR